MGNGHAMFNNVADLFFSHTYRSSSCCCVFVPQITNLIAGSSSLSGLPSGVRGSEIRKTNPLFKPSSNAFTDRSKTV